MQQIRLILMTSILSILIWVVADYSLSATASVRVRLEVIPAGRSDMTVKAMDIGAEPFEATIIGKKAEIAALKAKEPLRIRIPVQDRAPGTYRLRLVDELRAAPNDISDKVSSINPAELEIEVDHLRTEAMPVVVLPGTLDYEVPPVPSPATVQVSISELEYRNLDEADRRVVLDPDEVLQTAPRGELQSIAVPLVSLVGGINVQLDPDFVTLRFQLSDQSKIVTVPAVPIKFEASQDIFNAFDVEVEGAGSILTQPVTVKGPPEVVDRMLSGDIKIKGVISLTAEHKLESDSHYGTPRFDLPENVELTAEPERIEFRLIARAPKEAADS